MVGVPAALDHDMITNILARHGRVAAGPTPGRDPLLKCLDGTLHYKMCFSSALPLPPLPTFISVELESKEAGPNFVLQVYTDNPPQALLPLWGQPSRHGMQGAAYNQCRPG